MSRGTIGCIAIWLVAGSASAQDAPPPAGQAQPVVKVESPEPVPPLPASSAIPLDPPIGFVLPEAQAPGFFASVDLSILAPHVKSDLRGTVPLTSHVYPVDWIPEMFAPILRDSFTLPFAPQDATLAPKFFVGWRLADNRGAIQATYRNVASEGAERFVNFDWSGNAALWSRLDINEVGLSYATMEHPLGALWSLRWEAGARLATIFFDSQAYSRNLGQTSSNDFVGAGPQVALNVTREFPDTGLALFSRVDAADYIGRIEQKFSDRQGDPGSPYAYGFAQQDGSQAVPYLGVQAGLSWLSHFGRCRATLGYEFNQWWNVARLGDSRGWIQAQGGFLRTEFNY